MHKKVENYLNWYNVKKFYKNCDVLIFWKLKPSPKNQLLRMINKELRVWIITNTQSYLVNNKIDNLLDITIKVKKDDAFYDAKNLNNSSGVLNVEVVLEYNQNNTYNYHSIETTLIFQNGKIK